MKSKFFKFVFLIIILFFFSNKLYSEQSNCNFNTVDYLNNLDNFKYINSIEVIPQENRKWIINGVSIIKDRDTTTNRSLRVIKQKYKKKFDAKIKINYSFGSCNYKAKIRQTGDWKDHIGFLNGKLIQSISVDLVEGNIGGIVSFKLLIPSTRNFDNEIFTSYLFETLGIISPRTSYVNVNLNQKFTKMIFQENHKKEMQEYFMKRQSLLFEANEEQYWVKKKLNLNFETEFANSRVLGNNWIASNIMRYSIHNEALSRIQNSYLDIFFKKRLESSHFLNYNIITNNDINLNKFHEYHLTTLILGSIHSSIWHNRKFFWNSLNKNFEPIYYDGDSRFLDFYKTNYNLSKWSINELRESDKNYFLNQISSFDFDKFLKKIEAIDKKKFKTDLNNKGLDFNKKNIDVIFAKIIKEIVYLKNFVNQNKNTDFKNIENYKIEDIIKNLKNLSEINNNIIISFENNDSLKVNKNFLYKNKDLKEINVCQNGICEKIKINIDDYKKLISGRFYINQKPVYYYGNIKHLDIKDKFYNLVETKNFKITYSKNINFVFNEENNALVIDQLYPTDWIILEIKDNNDNLEIIFNGARINSENFDFSKNFDHGFGITGCLTILESVLKNVSIYSNNGFCEDSINIINSTGTINKIEVIKAASDAVDFDFSKVNIKNVKISDAKNDCIDFSGGNYEIEELSLEFCGDKALSLGEKSTLKAKTIFVDQSNIGVASKDSSFTNINNAYMSNLHTCLSSYNKKQEFNGSILNVEKLECSNFLYLKDLDNYSKIEIKELKEIKRINFAQHKTKNELNLIEDIELFTDNGKINYINEIEKNSSIKWEVSKITGNLEINFKNGKPRIIDYEPYPVNYGFIPKTVLPEKFGGDGDPLDALLLGKRVDRGEIIEVIPIGVLKMTDFGENDHKIVLIKAEEFDNISDDEKILDYYKKDIFKIIDWFENYKGEKIVNFLSLDNSTEAEKILYKAHKNYNLYGIRKR